MRRRLGLPISIALAVLLLTTASASAAVSDEAGWGCTADSSRAGWTLLAAPLPGSPYSPLVKESPGVIVSWRVRVGSGLSPLAQQLGVFRPVNGGAEYTKVAESPIETFGEKTEAVPTRIPVQAGDLIGLHGPEATFACSEQGSPAPALFEGDVGLGETRAFKAEPGARAPVIAVVESDADGDGYGDASQDRCPESALFQAPCPLVALDIGKVAVKSQAILIEVGNNTQASVEARGEVRWTTGARKSSQAKPGATRQVKVRLHSAATKTVTPGSTVELRVPLRRPILRQLDRLGPQQALRARIDIVATNLVPYSGTHELKVRLPGRARAGSAG
jgi:hypothetical protein